MNELNGGKLMNGTFHSTETQGSYYFASIGYAADGYARIKGIGVIMTTLGVGELSAINALAGACAELVPVIHIVGYPSTIVQKKRLPMHHTLADGDFRRFARMSAEISSAVVVLEDKSDASAAVPASLSILASQWILSRQM